MDLEEFVLPGGASGSHHHPGEREPLPGVEKHLIEASHQDEKTLVHTKQSRVTGVKTVKKILSAQQRRVPGAATHISWRTLMKSDESD